MRISDWSSDVCSSDLPTIGESDIGIEGANQTNTFLRLGRDDIEGFVMLLANEFFLAHPTLGHGFDFRHLKVDGEFETSLILTVLGFFQLHAGAVKDIGTARQVLETNLSDVRRTESSEFGTRKK